MCAYQQPNGFDRFDKDLINNAQAVQLWGRYLDEIEYFRGFSLTSTQQEEIDTVEASFSSVPDLVVDSDMINLQLIFYEAEAVFEDISSELSEPRKSTDWSDYAPTIDIQVDWIVGPGVPDAEEVVEAIEASLYTPREIEPFIDTTLPSPVYNITIDVHATTESFTDSVYNYWGSNMVESITSEFDPNEIPDDAWSTWPLNRMFQTQTGYEIDGRTVEQWLTDYPLTQDSPNKVHYRFYIMNLQNLIPVEGGMNILIPLALGGTGVAVMAGAYLVVRKRRLTE
jgi:hypothetical protein